MVVPYRDEMAKRHLKVVGDLGRVTFLVHFKADVVVLYLSDSQRHRNMISGTHNR